MYGNTRYRHAEHICHKSDSNTGPLTNAEIWLISTYRDFSLRTTVLIPQQNQFFTPGSEPSPELVILTLVYS